MESMPELEHPSGELLGSLLHAELSPQDCAQILNHLDTCAECSERLEEIEPMLRRHREYRELIDGHAPEPEWTDLSEGFDQRDSLRRSLTLSRPPSRAKRAIWAGAMAAGITLAALILWPTGERSVVRADTLLREAAAISSSRPAGALLRVQTVKTSFTRPGVLHGERPSAAEAAIRSKFAAARYDWSDPLNPAVYSNWRSGLKRKSDDVSVMRDGQSGKPRDYTIVTTASEEPLVKVSLTLEAPNLKPVGGKFLFADQVWVEISVLPESSQPVETAHSLPASFPAGAVVAVPEHTEKSGSSLAGREFKVRLAIDQLSASAGVPVQVEIASGDRIIVTPYGLGADQERQLRGRLTGQEGVEVRPNQPAAGPPPESAVSGSPSAVAIDLSDSIAACAHLLSQWAERFPVRAEVQLSPADRRLLQQMRRQHSVEMNSVIDKLGQELSATGGVTLEAVTSYPDSPPSMPALVDAATTVNRLATALYTRAEAASIRQQLPDEWKRLRQLARQYARSLEQSGEVTR